MVVIKDNLKDYFWRRLIKWYQSNAREYPWRKTSDPYHILLAEFMLQQTHVRAVSETYLKVVARFPRPELVAGCNVQEIKELLEPLGLFYRGDRIKRCCEIICKDYSGQVPNRRDELLNLLGVGEYIADAVLCYGYGEPTIPIDTNIIRVFGRFFGLESSKSRPRTDRELLQRIRDCYPQTASTRDVNLAVLDFASAVCTAKKPDCRRCIVRKGCIKLEK